MSVDFTELKEKALELGWDDMGVTPALIPKEDIQAYHNWLKKDYQGPLEYMENDIRCAPDKILPGAKSAIIFLSHYKNDHVPFEENKGVVASYARGRDYHNVHRHRLRRFANWLKERVDTEHTSKGFSDSTPILEKALAVKAGLGWIGKNTLLIHRKFGTFTLLSGLLTTLELPTYSGPSLRLPKCGVCTRCLDACPTGALGSPYQVNASLCLSTHLIEKPGPTDPDIQKKNPGYVFGCDACQDSCPHNVRPPKAQSPDFQNEAGVGPYLNKEDIDRFQENPELLFGTPLRRRKPQGLAWNLESLPNNKKSS